MRFLTHGFKFRTVATKLAVCIALIAGTAGVVILGIIAISASDAKVTAGRVRTMQEQTRVTASDIAETVRTNAMHQTAAIDAARAAQLAFRREVIAFKSLLLRGHRPDQEAKYKTAFEADETAVKEACQRLLTEIGEDEKMQATVTKFLDLHTKLGKSYRIALRMIDLQETRAEGVRSADDYMVGREDEPIALLDGVVERTALLGALRLKGAVDAGKHHLDSETTTVLNRVQNDMAAALNRNLFLGVCALFLVMGMTALVLWFVKRGIRPLRATVQILEGVACGDYSQRITVQTHDEIAQMAHSLNRTVETLDTQHRTMRSNASELDDSSTLLITSSKQLSEGSNQMTQRAEQVSADARQVAENMRSASSGAGELTLAISNIAQEASAAASIANQADATAQQASEAMLKLETTITSMSLIAEQVSKVAKKVHLLSLNASIEAARAGAAGRGFAVVAEEVKDLALSASAAVKDIDQRINQALTGTQDTVISVTAIRSEIAHIRHGQEAIAAAIEEQKTVTAGLASQVNEATQAAERIQEAMNAMVQTSHTTRASASDTHAAADKLSSMSRKLRDLLHMEDGSDLDGADDSANTPVAAAKQMTDHQAPLTGQPLPA